ncbi:MAG: SDR family oxidoreductase [Brumimicrobium sp.]|nr:SDR family oxidoreductase [Brumimicrobium sp.]
MNLKNKIVLITGGNSGLGKATAELMIEKGAKVIITGRDYEKSKEVAKNIGALPYACDVTDDEQIDDLYKFIMEEFGRLDILINNAGIGGHYPLTEISREEMKRTYEVNVFGATMVARGAALIFKEQQNGNIVNVASTASLKGYANGSIYSSSKFALRGLTQCWQAELRKHNVRVIQINPSEVPTAFGNEETRKEKPLEENKLSPREIAHTIVSSLEMDNRGYIPEVTVHATNPF